MAPLSVNPRFIPDPLLRDRIAAGERVAHDQALTLLRDWPLHDLGALAFAQKRKRHGDAVTFIVNRQINPTNLCVHSCKFCEFAAKPGDAHQYSLEEDDILQTLSDPAITEVHIVGGLWKTWKLDRSLALVRRIRAERPDLWIKAFTAVEVDFFAKTSRQSWAHVLQAMREAGVDGMPGGGAEVLSERVHQELYRDKIGPDKYIAIHETAHAIGLPTNSTLLFGHIETDEEIVDHLLQLRASQDKVTDADGRAKPGMGRFESFIPLAFQPGETGITTSLVSPMRCLRVIALARLVLDNIPHIKAYWPTLQLETGVAAITYGADDLDGTLGRERIMQLAGTGAPEGMGVTLMEQLIRDAGQEPRQRTGRFDLVPNPPAAELAAA